MTLSQDPNTAARDAPGPALPISDRASARWPFVHTYARLPERFYARHDPVPVAAPRLVKLNRDLADSLGLDPDAVSGPDGTAVLAGNRVPDTAEPIALAYAGHQFGHFVPQLGDGRAILLGELVGRDGVRRDIQLKGAGRTPFSRGGDGRAALGPVLREYIVSEAMAALGVPTTRALAAVMTGEPVRRETMLPGAILTRVAASHIRVGSFQYFAARKDLDGLRTLADYAIARHYQQAQQTEQPYRALLEMVIARQADLIAQWMLLGFIHGVMNTDNTAISGETVDYGPCAFMDAYDPATVFSSIDHYGRYAYGNQPGVAQWNLTRFAESLLPLLDADADAAVDAARQALGGFAPRFEAVHLRGLRRKLGLLTDQAGDADLARDLLERMAANGADFTRTFRLLGDAAARPHGDAAVRALFSDPTAYDSWAVQWRRRLAEDPAAPEARDAAMRAANPARIPRNHLVEAALAAAVEHEDFGPFEALVSALSRPYDDVAGLDRYAVAPAPPAQPYVTFCGT